MFNPNTWTNGYLTDTLPTESNNRKPAAAVARLATQQVEMTGVAFGGIPRHSYDHDIAFPALDQIRLPPRSATVGRSRIRNSRTSEPNAMAGQFSAARGALPAEESV